MNEPASDPSPAPAPVAPAAPATGDQADIDRDNPWPGLASFTERQSELFFGRDEEAEELFRLVRRDELTVLHGQSGLGKTSLLQAGVFPRLRQQDFLPVLVRVDYSPQALPPVEQVKLALAQAILEGGVDAPLPGPDRSLWEYFHDPATDFWSPRQRLLTPVLVFDQFEELFTIGQADEESRRRGMQFVSELACLVENAPPPEVAARLDAAATGLAGPGGIDLAKHAGKFVLSLRSDFLAELESLEPLAHGLTRNRMRLRRMSGAQALEVVTGPGGGLVGAAVARQIVQFVAGEEVPRDAFTPEGGPAADSPATAKDTPVEHLEVEPALLSLVCRELNARRQRAALTTITAELLAGHRQGILSGFYDQCLDSMPDAIRRFIEDRLLTRSGHRSNVAVEDAVATEGVTRADLDRLVFRRLLHSEERMGALCVELAHDVLTTPVRASRDARRQREVVRAAELKAERAALEGRRRRRFLFFMTFGGLLTIGALISLAILAVRQRDQANRNATAAGVSQRKAEEAAAIARHRLTDLYVREGWSRADGGEPGRALLYFSRAMANAANDPAGERDARVRFGTTLAIVPRIIDLPGDMRLRPGSTSGNREIRTRGNAVIVVDLGNGRTLFTLKHPSDVRAARFSPDGRWLVTASGDSTARLWDATTGAPVGEPLQHSAPVHFAAFSPDSRLVVTAAQDNTAKIWESATARLVNSLDHPSYVWCVEFRPDGTQFATGCEDGKVRFWSTATGREVMPPLQHSKGVLILSYSPDGALLATGCKDYAARLWNAVDGQLTATLPHDGWVYCLAFSPDGRRLVTGSQDHTARVWDTSTGKPLAPPLRYLEEVGYAAFTTDGRYVAAGLHDHTNRAWDLASVQPPAPRIQHQGNVLSAEFSPDGSRIVTSGDDKTARVWEAASGQPVTPPLQHGGVVRTAVFSPDGRKVLTSCDDGAARVWDLGKGSLFAPLVLRHQDVVYSAAFSNDGTRVVTASKDKTARIWDAVSGLQLPAPPPFNGPVWCAVFSPDGRFIAMGGSDGIPPESSGIARVWDVNRGIVVAAFKHADRVTSVAFSPDGTRLVTASRDRTAQVWDVAKGVAVNGPLRQNAAVRSAAFSPDGLKVVTASDDRNARVWDAATGQPATPFLRHDGPVRVAVFSFDGTRVLTASDDESARVWDAAGGLPLTPPLKHKGEVWCAGFSPDGRRVVSGGKDNLARIWQIDPDPRPAADLQALAELLASERVDSADGLEYLTKEQWQDNSRALHKSMPEEFQPAPTTQPATVPTTEQAETRPGR